MRAGQECKNLFAPDAVEQIALSSMGIPRLINIICDTALLAAYRAGQKSISPEMIQKISHDLRLTEESEPKAAVFSSRAEKGEESVHFSEPNEEDFNARDPVTDDHTAVDEKRQWSFEEFPLGKKNKPNQVRRAKSFGLLKIASLLAIFVLAGSAAVLYFERERITTTKKLRFCQRTANKRTGRRKTGSKSFRERILRQDISGSGANAAGPVCRAGVPTVVAEDRPSAAERLLDGAENRTGATEDRSGGRRIPIWRR